MRAENPALDTENIIKLLLNTILTLVSPMFMHRGGRGVVFRDLLTGFVVVSVVVGARGLARRIVGIE